MGTIIYRGSTPVIKFKPLNDVSVADLGTPSIAIAQELVYLTPDVTVNTDDNSISAKLTEDDTLSLVEGVDTSAQQIWQQENGNIIRYPVHQLTVAETIMEEVESEPEPEPEIELSNLHPFMVYSPFEANGYFEEYSKDSEAYEAWAQATDPWNAHLEDYLMTYNVSESPSLADFRIIPTCTSTMFENTNYYLWVTAPGSGSIAISIELEIGQAFKSVNGGNSYSVTLTGNDVLVPLVATETVFNQPLFNMRVRTTGASGISKLGLALYEIKEGVATSAYKQYISYND